MRRFLFVYLFLAAVFFSYGLVGCAGSQEVAAPSAAAPDTMAQSDTTGAAGPNLQLLSIGDGGLQYENIHDETSVQLMPAEQYIGPRELSPNGDRLAFVYASGDAAHLAVVNLRTREVVDLHSSSAGTKYSLSWRPDGSALAFGYHMPTAEGDIGPGAISIASTDGSTRSLGCSDARKVFKWLPDGNIAVRDPDNLYIVSPDDCSTASSLDIRKMHKITYAPDGEHMAYIFRDLVYDRENAEYVPDSTLFIANARGGEKNEIFDDAYRARHMEWSSGGSQLAFDVRSEADRSRRQIILYNAESGRRTYLIPPQMAGSQDELYPRWSPNGDNVAFTLHRGESSHAAVHVMGQTRTLAPTDGPVWGWAQDRQVVVPGTDSTRIVNFQGSTVYALSAERDLVHVWPLDSES